MTALLALLVRGWPYLLGASLVAGGTGWTVHKFDSATLNAYKAQVSAQIASQQRALAKEWKDATDQRLAREKLNDELQSQNEALTQKLADTGADLELARRLRQLAETDAAGARAVSQAGGQSGAPGAAGHDGNQPTDEFTRATAAAAADCRVALFNWRTLQLQLAGQVDLQ